jgi:hypothetical protein
MVEELFVNVSGEPEYICMRMGYSTSGMKSGPGRSISGPTYDD